MLEDTNSLAGLKWQNSVDPDQMKELSDLHDLSVRKLSIITVLLSAAHLKATDPEVWFELQPFY